MTFDVEFQLDDKSFTLNETSAAAAEAAAERAEAAAEQAEAFISNAIDATLSIEGKAADAKAAGDAIDTLSGKIDAAFATDTASGSVASFSDGADGVPVKSLSVEIEPVQSGSGDPSPDNIRPISGWNSVKVARCGKNLFDGTLEVGGLAWATGAETATSTARRTGFIPVKPNTSYYEKMLHTGGSGYVFYDANKVKTGSAKTSTPTEPFTTLANAAYIRIVLLNVSSDSDTRFSLVESDTETDYIEYVGQTYEIPLPQTVYGGTLDVASGVLTVTHAVVDMGTLSWSRYTSSTNPLFRVSVPRQYSSEHPNVYGLCSCYGWYGNGTLSAMGTSMPDKQFGFQSTSNYVCVRDDSYSDAASFKTAVSGQMIFFPLAEQQTLTLTPEQVTTLLGQNNIYSDAGEVSVTYRADVGLYIDKRLNA